MTLNRIATYWLIYAGLITASGLAAIGLQLQRHGAFFPDSVDLVSRLQVLSQLIVYSVSIVGAIFVIRLIDRSTTVFKVSIYLILIWFVIFEGVVAIAGGSFSLSRFVAGSAIMIGPGIYILWRMKSEEHSVS